MQIVKSGAVAFAMLALLSVAATAQDAPIQFRLAPAKSNPTGCTSMDSSLSRVHTVTMMGDKAMVKSSGGIDDTMKQIADHIYATSFSLGGTKLDVLANAATAPRTLTVSYAKLGCQWNAIAP